VSGIYKGSILLKKSVSVFTTEKYASEIEIRVLSRGCSSVLHGQLLTNQNKGERIQGMNRVGPTIVDVKHLFDVAVIGSN